MILKGTTLKIDVDTTALEEQLSIARESICTAMRYTSTYTPVPSSYTSERSSVQHNEMLWSDFNLVYRRTPDLARYNDERPIVKEIFENSKRSMEMRYVVALAYDADEELKCPDTNRIIAVWGPGWTSKSRREIEHDMDLAGSLATHNAWRAVQADRRVLHETGNTVMMEPLEFDDICVVIKEF